MSVTSEKGKDSTRNKWAFVVRFDTVSLLFGLVAITLFVLLFLSWRIPTQELVLNQMSQKSITIDRGVAKLPLQSPLLPSDQAQASPPTIFAEDDLGRLRLQSPFVFPAWEQFLHDTIYASLPVARQSRIDVDRGDLPANVLTVAEVKPGGWTFGGKEMQVVVNPFTFEPAISLRDNAADRTTDLTPSNVLPRPFLLADNRQMYLTPSESMF